MQVNITPTPASAERVETLKSEIAYRTRLLDICNKIYSAANLDEILIDLKDEITSLFAAERLTLFVVDGKRRQLVSRFKTGGDIEEIRLPVSLDSIAGGAALLQKAINIQSVREPRELAAVHPQLKFDLRWDRKFGFDTQQVLAYPITYQKEKKYLLGVIELLNRKDGRRFTDVDEQSAAELAHILGIALYNQRRIAQTRATKFDDLLANRHITQKELDRAVTTARQAKQPVEEILIKDFKISPDQIGQSLSRFFEVPYVKYSDRLPIPGELLRGLKVPFMRNNMWVPLRSEDGSIVVAIDNPHDLQRTGEIKSLFSGKPLQFCVALKSDILKIIDLFTQDEKETAGIDSIIEQLQHEEVEIEEAEAAVGEQDSAVVQLVNKIILDAVARGASDIHIEPYPGKQNTAVRIRIDGACMLYQTIPYAYRNPVVARIKIMADLDIAERRKPQDGKIKFKKFGGRDVELRVATVPTQGGLEDVVMRILAAGEPIPLADIGFSKMNYDNFVDAITQPYGIIFVCGPTGSGKTTTLHSALGFINKTETKIWTAEDPVEITQRGLRQVQVKPKIGFDFAAAMRSFLRADPDVIMVGEMRDKETTAIGIEASLTGHLVLSTLHTNSAPESITRLLDMGMDPFNFADAILCILAQRLVRTLCKECRESFHPAEDQYRELVREYGVQAFKEKVRISYGEDFLLGRPNGCPYCNNTGYAGRMGIHELLTGTDRIKRLIQQQAQMEEIRAQAIDDGMTTLKQDGIEKVLQRVCDLMQVRKVCIK